MNDQRSDSGLSDHFSSRVRGHNRIFAYQSTPTDPVVLAVNDQLLVDASALPQVLASLKSMGVEATERTTLLAGLRQGDRFAPAPAPGSGDVHILGVKLTPNLDIVTLTRRLRSLGGVDPRAVSPNHVLVPAPVGHSCPSGPPSPVSLVPTVAPAVPSKPVSVIVIDSGYQWNPAWGANPLDGLCTLEVLEAESLGPDGQWHPSAPDVPDANADGILDALAGHANFIAGVIAQGCRDAKITIRNHNGGFQPDSDDFPTEASVARSLYLSAGADVIDVGFAFAALDDHISSVWDVAFGRIGDATVVVAPAGNQSSPTPYYPAALGFRYRALRPGQRGPYQNLLGVASIDPPGPAGTPPAERSSFSNYGSWVTCSAVGSNVVSTFLHVDMVLEDEPGALADAPARDFSTNCWASWNGTSFAAPMVAAAIASRLDGTRPPVEVWHALAASLELDPSGNLGRMVV